MESKMKRSCLPAAILLMIASGSPGAAETVDPVGISSSDAMLVRELETKSWAAWKSHDAIFFERFLSADHVEVHAFGVTGKAAVVEGVRNPACVVQSYTLGPFTLTSVSADTVLVVYRAEQDTTCGEIKIPSPVWATSLYARRAGQWVNVLYQHTPMGRG